jgi:PAS domain S-box-containing protein
LPSRRPRSLKRCIAKIGYRHEQRQASTGTLLFRASQPKSPPRHPDHTDLETRHRALITERDALKAELADCSVHLKAATTALMAVDKSGLIVSANPSAAALLGADESYLLNKPISLFIAPQDQATFFINRSRVMAGPQPPPFEIKLRAKGGTLLAVRITTHAIASADQQLPGMLLAMDDITAYRQALEHLQFKSDFANLLFSTIDDLASWSSADIEEIIIYALEKIGIASRADRVYVCLFHEQRRRLSISHEWLGEGIIAPTLQNKPVGPFLKVFKKINNQNAVSIADVSTLAPTERTVHGDFHAVGVKSFLYTPLFYGRTLLGIIGCDAVKQPVDWPTETRQLVRCIGISIIQALIRRQTEKAPDSARESIFQLVEPMQPAEEDGVPEYDGPIEIVDERSDLAEGKATDWRFAEEAPDDPHQTTTVFLKDGKTASIACNHCNRQRQLDISEIRVVGSQLKATCVCGTVKYIKVELRREHRKTVNLKGVFMRGPGDRLALKSDDWGPIEVHNLSRRGIGFKAIGKADIRVKDRFRVQFTLDNTAESVIQKEVVVRSMVGGMIGCQFEGQDACDVTLGFYMMN